MQKWYKTVRGDIRLVIRFLKLEGCLSWICENKSICVFNSWTFVYI